MLIPLARFAPQRTLLPAQLLFRAHYGQLPVVTEVATQKIRHNTSSSTPLPSPHHTDSQLSIYDGPFSQTAKRLKLFSVSSLGATVALCPFIFLLDAGISNGMRGGLAVAAVATSGSSTALVQWCLGSYVRKITIPDLSSSSSSSDSSTAVVTRSTPVSFETLSFWGGKRITTVKVSDLEPSSAPFSTIRIRAGQSSTVRDGRGRVLSEGNQLKKRFYLHSELAEEEPLRTIMAEIQQNQHVVVTSKLAASSPSSPSTKKEKGEGEGATSGGMSERIEQLKRKAENAKKEQ
ncbi:hypothetical protein CPC16_000766 [Podila verticillata]|nr:hypothetical protein CPC16_000766 [Podila verticillata]KFH67533.1 hypothetical protein MVEG_06265 [Podila verticillata NRRL 6337]